MKKRLRKKKYLGEFAVWYWTLLLEFIPELQRSRLIEIREDLFALLNTNNLSWQGGSNVKRLIFYIDADKRYDSVTEPQRQIISAWALEIPEVARIIERPLVRTWFK